MSCFSLTFDVQGRKKIDVGNLVVTFEINSVKYCPCFSLSVSNLTI